MNPDDVVSDITAKIQAQALAGNLDELLRRVEAFQRRYVAFANPAQPVATSLHVVHAHAIEGADATPYLNAHSAEKRSGKTRFLETYELLVPNPVRGSSMTPSVLFRVLDASRATLLLDEVDAIFSPKSDREELRGLLNSGYRRGSPAWRIAKTKDGFVPTPYDAFGAKVLAGIGKLPDTIADRCIPIELKRRRRDEQLERFRYREAKAEAALLRDALKAWATDEVVAALRAARPELPDLEDDRALEGWEPLLAIADMAGGEWPTRARAACLALHVDHSGTPTEDSTGVLTLAAIKDVFDSLGTDRIATDDLLDELASRDDGPWPLWFDDVGRTDRDGTPIPARRSARKLARALEIHGIRPDSIRLEDGRKVRGYLREWFGEAWFRYLPSGDTSGDVVTWSNVVERGQTWADEPPDHVQPQVTTDDHITLSPTPAPSLCVRCDRYGADHVGDHIDAWGKGGV